MIFDDALANFESTGKRFSHPDRCDLFADTTVANHKVLMGLLSWSGLFLHTPWGFLSFGSSSMVLYEGYDVSELGLLLTVIAVALLAGVFALGTVADAMDPKKLVLVSRVTILAGGGAHHFYTGVLGGAAGLSAARPGPQRLEYRAVQPAVARGAGL